MGFRYEILSHFHKRSLLKGHYRVLIFKGQIFFYKKEIYDHLVNIDLNDF